MSLADDFSADGAAASVPVPPDACKSAADSRAEDTQPETSTSLFIRNANYFANALGLEARDIAAAYDGDRHDLSNQFNTHSRFSRAWTEDILLGAGACGITLLAAAGQPWTLLIGVPLAGGFLMMVRHSMYNASGLIEVAERRVRETVKRYLDNGGKPPVP